MKTGIPFSAEQQCTPKDESKGLFYEFEDLPLEQCTYSWKAEVTTMIMCRDLVGMRYDDDRTKT